MCTPIHTHTHTHTQVLKLLRRKDTLCEYIIIEDFMASQWFKVGLECILRFDHRAITKDRDNMGKKYQKEKDMLICHHWPKNCGSLKKVMSTCHGWVGTVV